MKEEIHQRLEVLRGEYEKGQERLRELQSQASHLQETLLRISGAMQVLSELLEQESGNSKEPGSRKAKVEDKS